MSHTRASKIPERIFWWAMKLFTEKIRKIFIGSKKLYPKKKLSQKTTFFSIFVWKITVFFIKKIRVFEILPKILYKKSLNFVLYPLKKTIWKSEHLECWKSFWNGLQMLLFLAALATDLKKNFSPKFSIRIGGGWLRIQTFLPDN